MVHYFLVNTNNSSDYYKIGVLTDKSIDDVALYFQRYSSNVRYSSTKEEPSRKEKGKRLCSVGTICFCRYYAYMAGFSNRKLSDYVDKRCSCG